MYDDADFEKTCELVDSTTEYGLTGSIFGADRAALVLASHKLRRAAGNFYVNDKCTGAVVGQQPFGGARASGTNDKSGSINIFYRFIVSGTSLGVYPETHETQVCPVDQGEFHHTCGVLIPVKHVIETRSRVLPRNVMVAMHISRKRFW